MLLLTVNAVVAAIFAAFARSSLPRGITFVRSGWEILAPNAAHPDASTDIERRQAVSAGATLLVAGLLWVGAGIISLVLAIYFAVQALRATMI